MKTVVLFHRTASWSGVGPPLVSRSLSGRTVLVPSPTHPEGEGVMKCSHCSVIFDVYVRTREEQRYAVKTHRRYAARIALLAMLASSISLTLGVAFAALQGDGHIKDAFLYGTWVPASVCGMLFSIIMLLVLLFYRAPQIILTPRSTQAGLHDIRFQKS